MNFSYGNSSYSSYLPPSSSESSSTSSDESDSTNQLMNQAAEFDRQRALVAQGCANANLMLAEYLIQRPDASTHGGSVRGHVVINRDREATHRRLIEDYFAENPQYGEDKFRLTFRMKRTLFIRIVDAVKSHDNYFKQRIDGIGRQGLSTLQKATAAMRILAYGLPGDATDEYIKIGESTAIESVKRFCRAIVEVFAERYMRSPTTNDIGRLLYIGEQRDFPGMLGSLDCMHLRWKNCPTAWAGQYSGRSGSPTIILEAVADYDLWIWHAYFGMPGSNNDINVLDSSPLFSSISQGTAPPAHYVIQGNEYDTGYYLSDGIYPKWSTLVQTIHNPQGPKKKLLAQKQEACRKDVERAFGVLQARFAIMKGPVRFWKKHNLHDIMTTCIIMHNMIIEDERDLYAPIIENRRYDFPQAPPVECVMDENTRFQEFLSRYRKVRDKDAHFVLRNALIEHIWENFSMSE